MQELEYTFVLALLFTNFEPLKTTVPSLVLEQSFKNNTHLFLVTLRDSL